jgi:hypothetical protein
MHAYIHTYHDFLLSMKKKLQDARDGTTSYIAKKHVDDTTSYIVKNHVDNTTSYTVKKHIDSDEEDDSEEETAIDDLGYDEEYTSAWRARRDLAKEEYANSLTPEQCRAYDEFNRTIDVGMQNDLWDMGCYNTLGFGSSNTLS